MLSKKTLNLVEKLSNELQNKNWKLSTAESCTAGLISAAMTEMAGSSAVFDRGFVTYSNQAKVAMLGMKLETLNQFGAVSSETAIDMAKGALGDISVAVTGIAGPDGGTDDKPVGLVYIAVATANETEVFKCNFDGDRAEVREQTVDKALEYLIARCRVV